MNIFKAFTKDLYQTSQKIRELCVQNCWRVNVLETGPILSSVSCGPTVNLWYNISKVQNMVLCEVKNRNTHLGLQQIHPETI
jgi:hypothetical protein